MHLVRDLDEVRDAAQNVFLGDGVEEADKVVIQEHEVAHDILLGPVDRKDLMNFSPQERGGETAEVQWPRRVEHVLKGDGDQLQQWSDACVGVGHDGASFVPFVLAFHHDVA